MFVLTLDYVISDHLMFITYSCDHLKSLNKNKLTLQPSVWKVCKQLELVHGTKRGTRSGKWIKELNKTHSLKYVSTKSVKESPPEKLTFGYVNAQSAKRKACELRNFVLDNNYDIFFISETWFGDIGDEVLIKRLTPQGYSFLHCPRKGGKGGGVGLLFRSHLKIVNVTKSVEFESFEYIHVRLTLCKNTLALVCIYRPPPSTKNQLNTSKFYDEFPILLDFFLETEKFLIIGDVNIHYNKKSDPNTKKVLSLLDNRNLKQWINAPTHNKGNILDWAISHRTGDSFISSVEVQDYLLSDHFVISIDTDFSKPKCVPKKIVCRNLKGVSVQNFSTDLSNSELIVDPPNDLNELTELYNSTLSTLLDKHAPLKEKTVIDRNNQGFDEKAQEAKRLKRESERQWRKSGLTVHKQIFRQRKNEYNVIVEQSSAKHIQNELKESINNPKRTFDIVNNLLGKDASSPILPNLDENLAAETISTYFTEKIVNISSDLENAASQLPDTSEDNIDCTGSVLTSFVPVNENTVKKIINKSKKTSCLLDPAPTKFLLQFLDILLPVIVLIINKSLQQGCVPDCLKKAIVKPLLKKPTLDPLQCKNYRPVSNLPFISKILERVIAAQLLDHLNENSYLDKFQSAYRPGFSTETALLKVVNDSLISLNSGDLVLIVLLDLSAAFDTINHNLLLEKLKTTSGLNDLALQWFASYLSNRSQSVLVGSSFSRETELVCGVPQGSVLGPILFSIYTSSLGQLIAKCGVGRQFFADDSQLLNSFSPNPNDVSLVIERLETCCKEIKLWMTKNRLKLNEEKTEAILIGSKENRELVDLKTINVGDATINIVDKVRNLGLILDSNLSMTAHVNHVIKSCYFHLRRLGQIRHLLTKETANAIAVATITSRLDYCNSTLWGIPSRDLERLQKVQNTAARIVAQTNRRDHITPVLRELHWLPVKFRIEYKILCLTYSCLNGESPEYLKELIPRYNPSRNLRSSNQNRLRLPSVEDTNKSRTGGRSFQNSAPNLWNELPENLKNVKTIDLFRKRLKTYLFAEKK